jgi:hypothetical protein
MVRMICLFIRCYGYHRFEACVSLESEAALRLCSCRIRVKSKCELIASLFYVSNLSSPQVLNQVILWDKIIQSPSEAWIKETDEFVKYALIDQGQELR